MSIPVIPIPTPLKAPGNLDSSDLCVICLFGVVLVSGGGAVGKRSGQACRETEALTSVSL